MKSFVYLCWIVDILSMHWLVSRNGSQWLTLLVMWHSWLSWLSYTAQQCLSFVACFSKSSSSFFLGGFKSRRKKVTLPEQNQVCWWRGLFIGILVYRHCVRHIQMLKRHHVFAGLYGSFLNGQGHQGIFVSFFLSVSRALWQWLRGMEAIASVASVKYQSARSAVDFTKLFLN